VYAQLLRWKLPQKYFKAVTTGFIGSMTTFSTFSVETLNLIQNDRPGTALAYVVISIAGGLASSWYGIYLAGIRENSTKENY